MDRNVIVIADDAELNRDMIKTIFQEQYEIVEAENGQETIDILSEIQSKVCLLFLDLIMPVKNGLDVLKYMNLNGLIDEIPVIMITGEATSATDVQAYELGASDIIYKPFAVQVVMRRAMNIMELFEHRMHLERKLAERTEELIRSKEKIQRSNDFLVDALSTVIEFRSMESGEHILRVKYFTKILMKYLRNFYPKYHITKEQAELIVTASALHDIGKIAIPDNILLKPGKLTDSEFEEMKKHTIYGCKILEKFKQADNEFYHYCYDICRYHHERFDGKGYPDRLVGSQIPIWAQIVSIVDVFDALVSKRVYKIPYAADEAYRMINQGECGAFSPDVLDCFNMAKTELFTFSEVDPSYADSVLK